MRGKANYRSYDASVTGITPAHAGKRREELEGVLENEDHPRPCGEKRALIHPKLYSLGSPPPMRGKVINLHENCLANRITPAHAGKSSPSCPRPEGREDHPRPCGEKEGALPCGAGR